ncbi:MAG: cobalamin biosynthesis protein CobD [Candidatus Schekmanbacteria bacterium]|nr:cobalamin biosynthesis protein CobD [Candidatus Schekmanbacteria bacterium]
MWELAVACVLDLILGDPAWMSHPVVGIGKLITWGEGLFYSRFKNQRLGGIFLVFLVVGAAFFLPVVLINLVSKLNIYLGRFVSVILIFFCLSLRSLELAARRVYGHLSNQNLPAARIALTHLVGRDTENLNEGEIARATVESVAENTVDGFVAPFFYALLGGAPLALAYKAVNTLDSMVGYRNERYYYFGWASARLDDLANYLPARLCYLLIPIAAGIKRFFYVYRIILRDGRKHLSPNSGLSEAGFAAALGVQLGGENHYDGELCPHPLIGNKERDLGKEDIRRTINLMYRIAVILFCLGGLFYIFSRPLPHPAYIIV